MTTERTRRRRTIAWAVLITYSVVLIACSVLPSGMLNLPVAELPGTYRTAHALAYAGLAYLLCAALGAGTSGTMATALRAVLLAALVGGTLELAQLLVPSRHACIADFLANVPGSMLGASAWMLWKRLSSLRARSSTGTGSIL